MRSVGTLTRADLAETINRKMGFSRAESLDLVEAILDKSRRKNPARGLTGILCFSDDLFIQVLEGGRIDGAKAIATINASGRFHNGLARHHGLRQVIAEALKRSGFDQV